MLGKTMIFVFLFSAAIFQTSFLPNFFPAGAVPDLVLIFVIFWAARSGFEESWKRAVLGGLLVDLASFYPPGINILSFFIVAFGTSSLAKRFLVAHQTWKFVIMFALVAIGIATNELFGGLMLEAVGGLRKIKDGATFLNFDYVFLLRIFYGLVAFAMIYWPLKKWENYFSLRWKGAAFKK